MRLELKKTSPSPASLTEGLAALGGLLTEVLKGKSGIQETILCALASQGHVLLEDVPGVGKTTVVRALARMLGLGMARIQCTSDLLPSDILGVEVYSTQKDQFVFHPGPVFTPILFVDELNRCSPRTQSALLEAMAEGSVTVNRKVYPLPSPFLVFATQNPAEFTGTYPLPESQLDRFAARIQMGYPERSKEVEILMGAKRDPLEGIPESVVDKTFLKDLAEATDRIQLSDRLVEYAVRVVEQTRNHPAVRVGVSTRGAVSWLRMAKARAFLLGRAYVIPDDLLALAPYTLTHRLVTRAEGGASAVLTEVLKTVAVG